MKKLFENKQAMIESLAPMAIGIVIFAVILITGIVVTQNLSAATGCNGVTGINGEVTAFNISTGVCQNATGGGPTTTYTATGAGRTGYYLQGKLGEGSGGLAAWTPAIIALMIGVMFIGAFAGGFGRKKQY